MSSRWLMISSAAVSGALGLCLTFAPREVANLIEDGTGSSPLGLQLLGAALLGWSMVNWMARGSLFGGIYNRPLVVGNLLHWFAGAMAIFKTSTPEGSPLLFGLGVIYALNAIIFGWMLFRRPLASTRSDDDRTGPVSS